MLKHCRPDILARGHLSLLHRDNIHNERTHSHQLCRIEGSWSAGVCDEDHKVQNMDSIERRIGTMEKEISSMKATLEKVLDAAKDAKHFSRKSYMEKGGKREYIFQLKQRSEHISA